MAKVIFGMTMLLDGFINDANGGVGLLFPDLKDLDQTGLMQVAGVLNAGGPPNMERIAAVM